MGTLSDNQEHPRKSHVFGPVPSRRLGVSLGLDVVPFKTCTLDCVYCEVGRTTCRTVDRTALVPAETVLADLDKVLPDLAPRLDYVTLAGSGEPTLNPDLGRIIRGVKERTDVRVAVLTNGTLLFRPDVRRDLLEADLVVPSLDSAIADTYRRVNRPHPDLSLERIIEGIRAFRREFSGALWLEILLCAGINDGPQELLALREAIALIGPDRVQVNTVYRPPADEDAHALTKERLEEAARYLGEAVEPVGAFAERPDAGETADARQAVLELVGRRPCTIKDVADGLGFSEERAAGLIKGLIIGNRIHAEEHDGQIYYRRDGQ